MRTATGATSVTRCGAGPVVFRALCSFSRLWDSDQRPLVLRAVQAAQAQPNPRFLICPITGSTIAFLRRYSASPCSVESFTLIASFIALSWVFVDGGSFSPEIRAGAM